jgi:predicted ATP-binding protein involved in virulence
MIVTGVKVANVRAIEAAEFSFKPGFNLIVGVNGVGKSTVLDVLRTCMSHLLPLAAASRAKSFSFEVADIRSDFPLLDVTVTASVGGEEFQHTSRKWRERIAADDTQNLDRLRREILESNRLRDRARTLLRELEESFKVEDTYVLSRPVAEFRAATGTERGRPNCIYFATNRSVIERAAPAKGKSAGGVAAAYAAGLVARSWQLRQFAQWMRAQLALADEQPVAAQHINALRTAAQRFLPSYSNLRPDEEGARLLIDREGTALEVGALSDGERGVLAMVLDLARRLSQANPEMNDPLSDGSAVVLIDEIDLHLHPGWQRKIVRRLSEVFPQCQFIATTHSPQVVGEVEHERIQIISDGNVITPTHSFGVDSSRILEEIMDAPPRAAAVQTLLNDLSRQVSDKNLDAAMNLVAKLAEQLGENDADVIRARTLLEFLGGDE